MVSAKRITVPTVGRGPFDLGTVRDGRQAVVDDEGDVEHGLEVGLVEARERAPAVGGLHLRGGDDLFVALVVGVGAAVEAAELVVQDAVERDAERHVPAATVPAAWTISRSVCSSSSHVAAIPSIATRGDVEFDGVEHEHIGVAVDREVDRRRAR